MPVLENLSNEYLCRLNYQKIQSKVQKRLFYIIRESDID